ncbi:uncharacterized protein BCR38DRAFT_436837 [Pseudomassariella vexata]|uniref:Uncharacterized protein n=1 Tax=Pseudomassariella vexata TaxID=1141098 RepID=A0A1Y2DW04_9PEZI|nr:uncharacterized protein BCR38DRAFT_436837 [Pseudomassariella vexata]ORY63437.1 hypothetical protein BCR38DRAFT_436837 [Pseudomassariella vexata]
MDDAKPCTLTWWNLSFDGRYVRRAKKHIMIDPFRGGTPVLNLRSSRHPSLTKRMGVRRGRNSSGVGGSDTVYSKAPSSNTTMGRRGFIRTTKWKNGCLLTHPAQFDPHVIVDINSHLGSCAAAPLSQIMEIQKWKTSVRTRRTAHARSV